MGLAAGASGLFFLLDAMQDKPAAAWNLTPMVSPDFGGVGLHVEF
jgi:hypothetical protein